MLTPEVLHVAGPVEIDSTAFVPLYGDSTEKFVAAGQASTLRIGVGMDEGGAESNFGGNFPYVAGLTSQGSLIGVGGGGGAEAGDVEFYDIMIDTSGKLGQIQTLHLNVETSGSDAICISVHPTYGTGPTLGMTGIYGGHCNHDWYYSQTTWGTDSTGAAYKPNCFWLDGGKKKQHSLSAFRVNMEDLLASNKKTVGWDLKSTPNYCKGAFKFFSTIPKSPDDAVPAGLPTNGEDCNSDSCAILGRRMRRRGSTPAHPILLIRP